MKAKKWMVAVVVMGGAVSGMAQTASSGPAAPAATPGIPVLQAAPVAPATASTSDAGSDSANSARLTLKQVNEKRAQLALIEADAAIRKLTQPMEDASRKDAQVQEQMKMEALRKERSSAAERVQMNTVFLLATYGMSNKMNAEVKVGDLRLNVKNGDRLPSGHYVKEIRDDSIVISKNPKAKGGEVVYISSAEAASAYGQPDQKKAADQQQQQGQQWGSPLQGLVQQIQGGNRMPPLPGMPPQQ